MTIGEGDAEDILSEALALGVDRAILHNDPVLIKTTTAGRAKVLAAAIRKLRGVQLVLVSGRRLLIGSQRPEELARALVVAGVRIGE